MDKEYNKYKIPQKKKSFNEICFPKNYELQLPQKFVPKYIGPKSINKHILVFWQIGSGKTCCAIRIAEEWRGKRNIIIVLPASLRGNFYNELRTQCAGNNYITENEREILKKLDPTDKEYKKIIETSDERIMKYYKIYSYNKFLSLAEKKKINLKNSLLIIDEIQNIVSENGKYYEIIYDTIHNAPQDLRIALLSATPMFDKPSEIALIMNLLRIPTELPTGVQFDKMFVSIEKDDDGKLVYNMKNVDIFKDSIRGVISYFRGAPAYTFPEKHIKYVKCEMSEFQYRSYLTVLKSEPGEIKGFKHGNITKLPNNFFIGTRVISNISFPNRDINEDGFNSFDGKNIMDNLEKYSTKFAKILKKINSCNGTVFVYSNFKEYGGIKSFTRVLENYGYKNFMNHSIGKKRYAIWSGDEKPEYRETMRNIFNLTENSTGKYIKVICGSPAIKEGVSLYNVQQVHVLEPMWNIARLEQVIGRAVRYCSHKNMPKDMRYVNIYIYMAVHKNEKMTVDEYIADLAIQKYKLVNKFEQTLKEIAVDCELFKYGNEQDGKIKCDV